MARKKLLTEGEIRQFMKLAHLRPIGKKRLSEYGAGYPGQRDDELEMEEEEDVEEEAAPAVLTSSAYPEAGERDRSWEARASSSVHPAFAEQACYHRYAEVAG